MSSNEATSPRKKPPTKLKSFRVFGVLFFVAATWALGKESTWEATRGPFAASVTALQRVGGNLLFAGTDSGKLFRSSDEGHSWEEIPGDFDKRRITAIEAVSSSVYVGTDGNGVYESNDGGATWRLLNRQALPTPAVTSLAAFNGTLYVGTTGGVARMEPTPQGIRVWRPLVGGLRNVHVRDLKGLFSQLFAATNGGVFRFDPTTETWTPQNTGLTVPPSREVAPIRCLLAHGEFLFAGSSTSGVFRSRDRGNSWEPVREGMTSSNILTLASAGDVLYAGVAGEGVYRSDDNGSTWTPLFEGGSNKYPYALLVVEGGLLAGTFGTGVFRLETTTTRWIPSSEGMSNASTFALVDAGDALLAGTVGGVFRSTDGINWTLHNEGLRAVNVRSFGRLGGAIAAGFYRGGYALSHDGGRSWTPGDPALERATVRAFCEDGGRFFLAVSGRGVLVSETGSAWKTLEAFSAFPFVATLAAVNGRLYAGTEGKGLYESSDGGTSWNPQNEGLSTLAIFDLLVHRGRLFCATFGGGVYAWDESGKWVPHNEGLRDLQVRSLASAGEDLYAATANEGVFRSRDGGRSWQPLNDGLPDRNIRSLLLWSGYLYAATSREGVYRLPIPTE